MDALMRAHLAAAHAAAVASLASLGNVVKAIPNMVLQPVIPTHLNTAIRSLHAARCVCAPRHVALRKATQSAEGYCLGLPFFSAWPSKR